MPQILIAELKAGDIFILGLRIKIAWVDFYIEMSKIIIYAQARVNGGGNCAYPRQCWVLKLEHIYIYISVYFYKIYISAEN